MELNELSLDTISSLAAAISAAVAGWGLWMSAKATRQARQTQELQLFEGIFCGIRRLEEELHTAAASGAGREFLKGWRSLFLNTLEYFSFLVNRGHLRDESLTAFFSDAVIRWYQDIFLAQATTEEMSDPGIYPELKSLYKRLKP